MYACGSNKHNKAGLSLDFGSGMAASGGDDDNGTTDAAVATDARSPLSVAGDIVSAEEAHSFILVKAPDVQGKVVDVAMGAAHTAVLTLDGVV